jgi:uncharacterized membrane protein YkvA (DUF1232 family)
MRLRRFWQTLHDEALAFGFLLFSPACLGAKLLVLAGFSYIFMPLDLIPDRLPLIGHLDEAGFGIAGLLAARLVAGEEIAVARMAALARHQGRPANGRLRLDGAIASGWLAQRRRITRLGGRLASDATRARAHLARAVAARDWRSAAFSLAGYRLWWLARAPLSRRRSALRGLVVIGGAPRSGTTLLRSILGRHPAIVSGPETTVFLRRISSPADLSERLGFPAGEIESWQISSRSQLEFIETCARAVLNQSGKRVWAEKTPHNVLRFGYVRRHFPHAKLVHIVRDGRDVVCSLRQEPFSKTETTAPDSAGAARLCARQWRSHVVAGLRFRGDPAYFELRYEDLVRAPEPVLRDLMAFLELPWDDALLATGSDAAEPKASGRIFSASIGRWRRDLSQPDRRAVHETAGPCWSWPDIARMSRRRLFFLRNQNQKTPGPSRMLVPGG